MKKSDILSRYTVYRLDDETVLIKNDQFYFSYTTVSASYIKDESRDRFRYFGGLQCNYLKGSHDFKLLENWLCEVAENVLGIKPKIKAATVSAPLDERCGTCSFWTKLEDKDAPFSYGKCEFHDSRSSESYCCLQFNRK
jgi:hypothetical protein